MSVSPGDALYAEPVTISVRGLGAEARTTITAKTADAGGTVWSASAIFQASTGGVVSLDQPSLGGSYSGSSPMALFEFMTPPASDTEHGWRLPTARRSLRAPVAAGIIGGQPINLSRDRGSTAVANGEPSKKVGPADTDPRPAAVTFVTTEHFTLQGARSSTISESTGRASMFLGSVTGGLVALGLIATASNIGAAFYAFGLIILPTLAFVGLVTFDRVLQSGIEDHGYARRIVAWMRAVSRAAVAGGSGGSPKVAAYTCRREPGSSLATMPLTRCARRASPGMVVTPSPAATSVCITTMSSDV